MNFAFLALKTMRFYGWSWAELMATPISAFWTCLSYVDRIRADEAMASLDALTYPHADEAGRKQIVESLQSRKGSVSVEKPVMDVEGWNALKRISQS